MRNGKNPWKPVTTKMEPYIYFYTTNTNLPDCSMPEYIREKSSSDTWSNDSTNNMVCYTEGGNRTMCTKSYEVCLRKSTTEAAIGNWEDTLLHRYDPGGLLLDMERCESVIAESNGYSL